MTTVGGYGSMSRVEMRAEKMKCRIESMIDYNLRAGNVGINLYDHYRWWVRIAIRAWKRESLRDET